MHRVAVVVPCFNDGDTLPATLESLRGEEPHELAVVDDGSDDPATVETLAGLAAEGVNVVRRDNGGLSAARTTGVEATTAPLVFPLDADDEVVPGALAALADALDATTTAALAWGDILVWGELEAKLAVARSLDPWLLTYLNDVPVASMSAQGLLSYRLVMTNSSELRSRAATSSFGRQPWNVTTPSTPTRRAWSSSAERRTPSP